MTTTVEQELVELEKGYWQAIKDRNADAAMALSDDPCIVTDAQGIARIDRQTRANMMKAASYTLHDFELTKVQAHLLRDDVAVVAYKVHEQLTVDGTPLQLDAADASIWVRRDGRWLCALHTESIAGDPFGRDKRAAH
jgi:ketosteroid isomerase-like protein